SICFIHLLYSCTVQKEHGTEKMTVDLVVLSQSPRVLEPPHRDVTVDLGGTVELECKVDSHEVTWVLPSQVQMIAGQANGHVQQRVRVNDNGTLWISQASLTDTGTYRCTGNRVAGSDAVSVRLHVSARPPEIQQRKHENMTLMEGSFAYITCTATGIPQPIIHWTTPDGLKLSSSQTINGTLVVQKVQRYDGGNYTCIARNSVGQDHKVARLEILITPPVFSDQRGAARSVTAVQGQRMLLDCTAKGTPTPHITWILPGNVNLPAPYYSTRRTVHQNGTLEIQFPQKTDSGQLTCVAHNDGGEVRMSVNLEVKEAVGRPQTRPSVTDNVSLRLGTTAIFKTLNCFI
uniref:Ig-like domain-containing protein n=1 Tax=Nothobranchius furzeri TaxID=105023 RepID=A0A8C6LDF4_NOTFU